MKKIYFIFCLIFMSTFVLAANKIQMVTYFPVPYVAYSKVTPKNQLDIGLTSSCQMNLGCAQSSYSLRATTANLNRNRLDLNSAAAVVSTNVTIGSGYGPSNIDFAQNLRVGTLDRGYSLETNTMNVESLTLFASHMKSGGALFPDCRAKSGEETVSWQKVKLKNTEEVYLMCGTPKESVCNPPSGQPTSQSCPSGYTGTQTRTWNYSTCAWNPWQGTCTPVATCSDASYKASHKAECCPSTPKTDSVCWTFSVGQEERGWGAWAGGYCPVQWRSGGDTSSCESSSPSECTEDGQELCGDSYQCGSGCTGIGTECGEIDYVWVCDLRKNGW